MIPDLTQHQHDLMAMGLCPFCENRIKDWTPVFWAIAPEWWASIREKGIDPSSGHAKDCKYKQISL